MNNICKKVAICLPMVALLCSCGGSSVAKKGWNTYMIKVAENMAMPFDKIKDLLTKDLNKLDYVCYNDTAETIYYNGSMGGRSGLLGPNFYFFYLVEEDYANNCSAKEYQYAYELVSEGTVEGSIGKIK